MSIIQEALKKVEPPPASSSPKIEGVPEETIRKKEPLKQYPVSSGALLTKPKQKPNKSFWIKPALIISGILLALSAVVAIFAFPKTAPKPSPATLVSEPKAVTPQKKTHQDAIYKTIGEETDNQNIAPSAPETVVRSEPPDLVLNGVMHLETGPRAIINNNIVQEGDMVGGATVVLINKNSVILKYNNVEITLNLK